MRFSISQISPQAWKNGGGSTRELARAEASGGAEGLMIWRASLAQIDQDGAFSAFPGLARIHCITSGAGLQLTNAEIQLTAHPLKPLYFDGGLDLTARLKEGPCEAFNLIYDPNRVRAELKVCDAGSHEIGGGTQLVFVLGGTLQLDLPEAEISLGQGEGWHGTFDGLVDVAQGGRAVLVVLELI